MSDRHQAQAYPLRLPDALKLAVSESAKDNGRSINAEIVARLQASFEENPPHTDSQMVEVGKVIAEFLKCHMDTPTNNLPDGLQSFVRQTAPAGRFVFSDRKPKVMKKTGTG